MVHIAAEQVRQREDVEHAEAGANGGFAAAGGIRRQAHPRSEVLVRGIVEEIRVAGVNRCNCAAGKDVTIGG